MIAIHWLVIMISLGCCIFKISNLITFFFFTCIDICSMFVLKDFRVMLNNDFFG